MSLEPFLYICDDDLQVWDVESPLPQNQQILLARLSSKSNVARIFQIDVLSLETIAESFDANTINRSFAVIFSFEYPGTREYFIKDVLEILKSRQCFDAYNWFDCGPSKIGFYFAEAYAATLPKVIQEVLKATTLAKKCIVSKSVLRKLESVLN